MISACSSCNAEVNRDASFQLFLALFQLSVFLAVQLLVLLGAAMKVPLYSYSKSQ